MQITLIINNCGECPNYKFYKKCKVLNIKVEKKGINEKCPFNTSFNAVKDFVLTNKCRNDGRLKNKYVDRIKEILKTKNFTITELAKKFNISKVAMYTLISTVSKNHSNQRQKIADFLNVPYNLIFEAETTLDTKK